MLLCLTSVSLFAQKDFKDARIVTGDSDTLSGFIDYKNWLVNPREIVFKETGNSREKKLGLSDLLYFRVEGDSYVKAGVQVDISPAKGDFSASPNPEMEEQTVFLRTLVDGPKSLFHLRDGKGKDHFYIRDEETYVPLINYRYWADEQAMDKVITKARYKQQLINYLDQCPEVNRKAGLTGYTEKELIRLFQLYYSNCSAQGERLPERSHHFFQAGLIAAFSGSGLSLSGDNVSQSRAFLKGKNLPISVQPGGGIFLDFVLPRTKRQWIIHNEFLYTFLKGDIHHEDHKNENEFTISDVSIKYGYIKLNNLIRYQRKVSNAAIFFNVGISNGLAVNRRNYLRTDRRFFTDRTVTESKAIEMERKHEQGILAGIGAALGSFSLELRYEAGNGMSDYALASRTKRGYLLLGYRF